MSAAAIEVALAVSLALRALLATGGSRMTRTPSGPSKTRRPGPHS